MTKPYLQIDSQDNIIVALQDLAEETKVDIAGQQLILKKRITAKHKFALQDFKIGDELILYGVLIGKANVGLYHSSS